MGAHSRKEVRMKANDVMTPTVVAVAPETPVPEIARLMLERRVSGLPVIDAKGVVIGVVSEGDLMRRPEIDTDKPRSWWLRVFLSDEDLARRFAKTHGLHAKDIMTRPAVTVAPNAELTDVVHVLEAKRIKRVFVVDKGRVAGVITRADLLRALYAREVLAAKAVPPTDQEIRAQIVKALGEQEDWASGAVVNVQVADGVAHIWGQTEYESQRKALLLLVEGVPGVKAVVPHLVHRLAG
jgi:CBS domain-containing protein